MLVLWAGCEQERFKTRMARSVLHFPWKCLLKALICIYQYYCRSIRPEIKLGAIQVSSSAILMEGEIVPGLNWCFWEVRLCESKSQKWAGMISSMCHIITWTSDQRSLPSGHEGNQKFSKKGWFRGDASFCHLYMCPGCGCFLFLPSLALPEKHAVDQAAQ